MKITIDGIERDMTPEEELIYAPIDEPVVNQDSEIEELKNKIVELEEKIHILMTINGA